MQTKNVIKASKEESPDDSETESDDERRADDEKESQDETETDEPTKTDTKDKLPRPSQKKEKKQKSNNVIVQAIGDGPGSQKYAKSQFCIFCNEDAPPIVRVDRHIERCHKDEPDVQELQKLPKSSKQRKVVFMKLRNEGNFRHNISVLKAKEGTLIVARRPSSSENASSDNFTPCLSCLGFFTSQDLCRHDCKLAEGQDEHQVQKSSKEVLASLTSKTPEIAKLLSKMKNRDVASTIQQDWLLSKYGEGLIHKFSMRSNMDNHIREKLSEMAKLFLQLNQKYQDSDFASFFKPEFFDDIISAVHEITGKGKALKNPSLALKMGHGLKKCSAIVIGQSLRKRDEVSKVATQDFLQLMNNEWTEKVSKQALETLHTQKFNKPLTLPLTGDIVNLVTKIRKEMQSLVKKEDLDEKEFRRLAELTLARIILFNKRRVGEASQISIEAFESAKKSNATNQDNQELLGSLSDIEKKLAQSLLLIELRGKKGKKVPLLLSRDAQQATEVLMKNRQKKYIDQSNQFLFPVPRCLSAIQPHRCLRKFTEEFGCQRPELITGTNLRKYLATTVQVMNLAENEIDWLARHLGHDVRVHRDFYRQHESTVELAKISKLLIKSEKGEVQNLHHLTLDNIPEDDLLEDESEGDEDSEPDEASSANVPSKKEDPKPSTSTAQDPKVSPEKSKKKRSYIQEEDQDPDFDPNPIKKARKVKGDDGFRDELFNFFKDSIKKLKVPSKEDITEFIAETGSQLKWNKIKEILNARVQKEKRAQEK
ncbi:MAG: hypothetical protein FJ333_04940 [Sphingomonadales bacterium]|nr:hypothetical protein [Sphingomonadales bacterium]